MSNYKLDQDLICKMYVTGELSSLEIARKLNCSIAAVFKALERGGIQKRAAGGFRTRKAFGFVPTKEFMVEAMKYFNNVASDAAQYYGVKYATWVDALKKFNIPRGPTGASHETISRIRHEIPIEEAIKLSDSGVSYEELAKKYEVSFAIVSKRLLEVGYKAPKRRIKNPKFLSISYHKRKILQRLNITACEICGETRVLDFAHIKPASEGGPIADDNCLVLCANHHRMYDSNSLTPEELAKVQAKVDLAKQIYGGF